MVDEVSVDDDRISDDDPANGGIADDDDADDDDYYYDDDDDDDFDPTEYVDPFIGTMADHGQLSPAASVPFGMVKLGPDTLIQSHSGYDYGIPFTTGFSHTRIDGVGCSGAGGDIRILPGVGEETRHYLWMDKSTEVATPGYYAVNLGKEEILHASMTVTKHAGLHQYRFGSTGLKYLLIDFDSSFAGSVDSAWNEIPGEKGLNGWVSGKNVCGRGVYKLYFHIEFSQPAYNIEAITTLSGNQKARVAFEVKHGTPLFVKVGLSSANEEDAAVSVHKELSDHDFETIRAQAKHNWDKHLSAVKVIGEDEYLTLFYTMLYRASQTPVSITNEDGQYTGTDNQLHVAEDYERYHCWSLWDTYRNKFALHTLLFPDISRDMMKSLERFYIEGKAAWSTDFEPYPNVRTEHAPALLLDAYRKHLRSFDINAVFDHILAETLPSGAPDQELEASYDHWAIAHLAKIIGRDDVYDEYIALSADYQDVWIDHFRDMGADADIVGARGLYEGTLWQYRWAVVHDIPGMMELDSGREVFHDKLVEFFERELYNQGNEPDIHAPFLFNYAGAPWRTQDLVRALLSEKVNQWYSGHAKWPAPIYRRIFLPEPWGFILTMDEDAGTMSSWFVLASMGIYPVTIGQPIYALTAPLFEEVHIRFNYNKFFNVRAIGLSETNRFIQSAILDGEPLERAWLYHDEIAFGGSLELEMGPEPNESWSAAQEFEPPPAFE